MRNFLVQAYGVYKGLFFWLNWISYLSNIFLSPIIVVVSYSILGQFALGGTDAARRFGLGVIAARMSFVVISGVTMGYAGDRNQGTYSFFCVSRANRLVHYLSRPILHIPNGLLVFVTGLVTLGVVAHVDFGHTDWVAFISAAVVMTCATAALGQFLGIFAIIQRNWINTMNLGTGILFAFAGIIVPVSVFPPGIQHIANAMPITNALSAMRLALEGSSPEVFPLVLREAINGTAYLALGYLGFVLFERTAKRLGILEMQSV